jgi:hypothetical protein
VTSAQAKSSGDDFASALGLPDVGAGVKRQDPDGAGLHPAVSAAAHPGAVGNVGPRQRFAAGQQGGLVRLDREQVVRAGLEQLLGVLVTVQVLARVS